MQRTSPFTVILTVLSLSALGCSAAEDDPTSVDDALNPDDPADPGDPGGGPRNENPCGIHSGYPGDEFCLLPPDPSEGIQLHVGPTDYDDPEAVAPYLLAPGQENVVCYNDLAEDGGFHYFQQVNHMRSGSHHMLIGLHTAAGLREGPSGNCPPVPSGDLGGVPGSQRPISRIGFGEVAPEDVGLARWFPEGAMAMFQLHYVNTGSEPVMREAWANLYRKPAEEVTGLLRAVFLVGDIFVNVPPGERRITPLSYTPALTEPTRIYSLGGHSHAHSERFSAWRTRSGARQELLYESYDWAEPAALRYDSLTLNPAPDPVALRDGGFSGVLFLEPGDGLDFECEVNNTSDRALRFANEAYTAEMCLLGGAYVSDTGGFFSGICAAGSCG
jgi:hypothetical protein